MFVYSYADQKKYLSLKRCTDKQSIDNFQSDRKSDKSSISF